MTKIRYSTMKGDGDMSPEELQDLAAKMQDGKVDISADDVIKGLGIPMEGEITIRFKCKGGVALDGNPNQIQAGIFIEHEAKFGKFLEADLLDALNSPEQYLKIGEVAGIGAVLMEMIFNEDGALNQAIGKANKLFNAAEKLHQRDSLLRQLAESFDLDFDEIMEIASKVSGEEITLKNCKPEGSC